MTPPEEQKIERLISHAVRNLPPQAAPDSLVARVQAELARRAALPWWRKSFLHWPVAARAVFVVVAGAVIKLLVTALVWVTSGLSAAQVRATFAPEMQWLYQAQTLAHSAAEGVSRVMAVIPPGWLYGAAAIVIALYVALFGLGAAAYRTLYANR